MTNHEWIERSTAAGLSMGVWNAGSQGWHVLLAAAVVALIVLLRFVWLYRARSIRRWQAALDAYAAQEIARDLIRGPTSLKGVAYEDTF